MNELTTIIKEVNKVKNTRVAIEKSLAKQEATLKKQAIKTGKKHIDSVLKDLKAIGIDPSEVIMICPDTSEVSGLPHNIAGAQALKSDEIVINKIRNEFASNYKSMIEEKNNEIKLMEKQTAKIAMENKRLEEALIANQQEIIRLMALVNKSKEAVKTEPIIDAVEAKIVKSVETSSILKDIVIPEPEKQQITPVTTLSNKDLHIIKDIPRDANARKARKIFGTYKGIYFDATNSIKEIAVYNAPNEAFKIELEKLLVQENYLDITRQISDYGRVESLDDLFHEVEPNKFMGYMMHKNKPLCFVYDLNYKGPSQWPSVAYLEDRIAGIPYGSLKKKVGKDFILIMNRLTEMKRQRRIVLEQLHEDTKEDAKAFMTGSSNRVSKPIIAGQPLNKQLEKEKSEKDLAIKLNDLHTQDITPLCDIDFPENFLIGPQDVKPYVDPFAYAD